MATLFLILYSRFVSHNGLHYLGHKNYGWDLPSFWAASVQVFRHGGSPYAVESLQALMGADVDVSPYLYHPGSLLFFWPLSWMDCGTAWLAVLVANHALIFIMLCLISCFLLRGPRWSRNNALILAFTFTYVLNYQPIQPTLCSGQVDLLLLTFLIGFWVFSKKCAPFRAGLCLALAIFLKTYPLILLPLLVLVGRPKNALYTLFWLGLLVVLSFLVLPISLWCEWLTQVAPHGGYGRTMPGCSDFLTSVENQSLNAFFTRLFMQSQQSRLLFEQPALLARGLTYAAATAVAAVTAFAVWKGGRAASSLDRMIACALPAIFLIAPLSWEHHLVYVLPAILLLLTCRDRLPSLSALLFRTLCLLAAVIIALGVPPQWMFVKFFAIVIFWGCAIFAAMSDRVLFYGDEEEA